MIDVLRIAHLRIAPQEGNSEVGNCEVHPICTKHIKLGNLTKAKLLVEIIYLQFCAFDLFCFRKPIFF